MDFSALKVQDAFLALFFVQIIIYVLFLCIDVTTSTIFRPGLITINVDSSNTSR